MAGLVLGSPLAQDREGSNPDVSLLYDINGLAQDAPHWCDRVMEFVGEFGIVFGLLAMLFGAWWSARKRPDAASAVAGLVWAPLAAGIALLANIPIRGFVERPRPFVDHQGLEVLVAGKSDYSFVSDHSTLVAAIAVGIFMVSRKYGVVALILALLAGFCRVYMGVHYPTDVVGGFALGTAVTLLLAPLAMMLLTPLMTAVAGSRAGWLVRVGAPGVRTPGEQAKHGEPPSGTPGESGRPGPGGGTVAPVADKRRDSDLAA
ncbi:phosphatase PAP2 family protein [Streptomyces zagrosensis]|uniref:Undecaprenyl-diphosphatase n=1 Tax=Streptomyces zagrosensis TaxID=1042984 RepID=A0A7W9QI38_9ACTN|nr:phosphatase PAP2 family protein [Streptomyces zagrosensis]MBB5940123.1 undecaprenyl-diphosphatase [Streptomyces zagrosensis]